MVTTFDGLSTTSSAGKNSQKLRNLQEGLAELGNKAGNLNAFSSKDGEDGLAVRGEKEPKKEPKENIDMPGDLQSSAGQNVNVIIE